MESTLSATNVNRSPELPAGRQPGGPLRQAATTYAIETHGGERRVIGPEQPAFVVRVPSWDQWRHICRSGSYGAGIRFIEGAFDVAGDLIEAIRWWHRDRPSHSEREWVMRMVSRLNPDGWLQTAQRARRNIRFHYDRSNAFYRQFLDSRMVYSCAYFADPSWSLEEAQLAKLDHICRKLDLTLGDRFLDIGSGWGALIVRAAQRYQVQAMGCTLSHEQFSFATKVIAAAHLHDRVTVADRDYRDIDQSFEKIASVGMFEHVGRRRLGEYFRTVARLLTPDGLFLNHGIIRPENARDDGSTVFLQRRVFPGGELPRLGDVIREAERAGFEVLDVENLRPHYALTCQAWVRRLQSNREACLALVDGVTYRTWLLYLAAAAVSFEQAHTDIYQILFAKRAAVTTRHMSRQYMYKSM